MTRRILTSLRLDKIAAVDKPCQEGALATIIKRDFTADERRQAATSGAALPDGSFPIHTVGDLKNAVHDIGRASDPAKARAHIIARAKSLGATDQLPQDWNISKSGDAGNINGVLPMDELKKALGLPATATEAEVTAAIAKSLGSIATLTASNEALGAIVKMSPEHRAYAEAAGAVLPEGGIDAFAKLKPEERDAFIKAKAPPMAEDDDPDCAKALRAGTAFKTPEGVVVLKSKVGDEVFAVMKAQNARTVKLAEDLAKRDEADAIADFAKRATDVGFGAEFGPTLRKAYTGDRAAQTEVENRIVALQKQVAEGELFGNFGSNRGPAEGSASAEFAAKVAEVKKAKPSLTEQQAYAEAYSDRANRDVVKRMKAELQEAAAA